MAQQKNGNSRANNRSASDMSLSSDMESHDETFASAEPVRKQSRQSRTSQAKKQTSVQSSNRTSGNRSPSQQAGQNPAGELLSAVTPAFQEARRYIEGSPVRAAAVGAIAGGLLMTLFSTEKGRSFVKMAYDYANPMVAKYARDYISQAAVNMTEQALAQH